MRVNGLASTANTDSGQNEARFAFRQIIGQADDAAVVVSATFGLVHVDETGD